MAGKDIAAPSSADTLATNLARLPAERILLQLTVLVAALSFLLVRYPPMTDLPQQIGQFVLWRNLLAGWPAGQEIFEVNLFSPYLLPTALGLLVSFVFSPVTAANLLMAVSCGSFYLACFWLRARLKADPRLDWLFIPAFFGVAYELGLLSFIVAMPIGVAFMALCHAQATKAAWTRAGLLVVVGGALFFAHGLMFGSPCSLVAHFSAHAGIRYSRFLRRSRHPLVFWVAWLCSTSGLTPTATPTPAAPSYGLVGAILYGERGC